MSTPQPVRVGPARSGRLDRMTCSEQALYDYGMATYDSADTFDQSLAKGFVELWGLPSKMAARRDQRKAR